MGNRYDLTGGKTVREEVAEQQKGQTKMCPFLQGHPCAQTACAIWVDYGEGKCAIADIAESLSEVSFCAERM